MHFEVMKNGISIYHGMQSKQTELDLAKSSDDNRSQAEAKKIRRLIILRSFNLIAGQRTFAHLPDSAIFVYHSFFFILLFSWHPSIEG